MIHGIFCTHGVLLLASSLLVALLAGGQNRVLGAEPVPRGIYWHEGEDFTAAPQAVGSGTTIKAPASGGRTVNGNAYKAKGNFVTYQIDLPQAIDGAQIIFRYARLHWKTTMVPVKLKVELTDAGGTLTEREAVFPDTQGWGGKPSDWRLATVKLGALKPGKATLKLTGQGDDNDVSIDGFYIAPPDFAITAEELGLTRIAISSQGYTGLRSATTIRQDVDKAIVVVTREMGVKPQVKRVAIGKTADAAVPMTALASESGGNGAEAIRYELPKLEDGNYVVVIEGAAPPCAITVPVVLAGQFLGALDEKTASLETFTTELAASKKPADTDRLTEFQHALDYLKTNGKKLSATAASGGDAFKEGLAAHEGITDPAPVIDGLRRTLRQYTETMTRLKSGLDPYANRSGDLRLAFRSAVSGEVQVYRIWVPSSYEKADKVPFILMLHGGGGDENYFSDLDGGKVFSMVNELGYLVACPKWNSSNANAVADLQQLVALLGTRYPKIDPARRYCTGISMGGFGTYTMAAAKPDLFAAACCVSGTGKLDLAEKVKTVPLLILQGGADEVVPPAGATRVAARLKELGATVDLHIFPTYGHDYHTEEYLKLTLDFFERHQKK